MDKYNTLLKRIGAGIIDAVIFLPFTFLDSLVGQNKFLFLFIGLLYIAAWSIYTIGLHSRYGQTVGKRIVGVKVCNIHETNTIHVLTELRTLLVRFIWIADIQLFN
jgi:uncharacterized RDD family membrane protein YckC